MIGYIGPHIGHIAHGANPLIPRITRRHGIVGNIDVKGPMRKTVLVRHRRYKHFDADEEILQLRGKILIVVIAGICRTENVAHVAKVDEECDEDTLAVYGNDSYNCDANRVVVYVLIRTKTRRK